MKTRKKFFFLVISALLVCGMLLAGCSGSDPDEIITPPDNSVTQKEMGIARDPVSRSFTLAQWNAAPANLKTLSVEMTSDKGEISYKWYSKAAYQDNEGTEIEGQTNASFSPTITANGDYFYYVVVTVVTTKAGEEPETETFTSLTAWIKIADTVQAPTQFTIGPTRINYVRGIGGTGSFMFRDGNNADASPDADVTYIDKLMGEMGCNILRIMVQDDYLAYINNEVQSRNQDKFFHNARANFFAVIRRVNEYGGYVFANPWTAPGRFKDNGEIRGGGITETGPNYVGYANWLRDFLKWLNANNAPIFALGILNEPDNGLTANYEGMGMSSVVHRNWFSTVGHFTTQYVTNQSGAGVDSSIFEDDIIPGYGGGKPTHHVLAMTADNMGSPAYYNDIIGSQSGSSPANNNFEILGHHWYDSSLRVSRLAGPNGTIWDERPQVNYEGHYEQESIAMSPQMFAPGSIPGSIKREIWQTEHDYNYASASTNIPGSNPQRYWNSAFAVMNDVDWGLRVVHESVYDWWFSSSYSGLVTSYQGTPVVGSVGAPNAGAIPWPAYTYTPRGRAFAHYARYVNETWLLEIERTRGTIDFNRIPTSFNVGTVDPKISAFEDTDGKFISIVMFTPNASTATANIANATSSGRISNDFGQGGLNGTNDPTRLSVNVGKIEVVLPEGFTATGATALRSYGWENATGETWDDVPTGTPRYWIDEPVFLSTRDDGKSAVEVTLPGGNIISIMVKGSWTSPPAGRHFEPRKRPYTVR